ncbi:Longitudinals lacking protein, isoforms A/B/D/L [Cyphomyrmex costatus]|uniref:Longitudinals lacking protein, isoforms A/B/D/L n=1 Tax=Cyphomyrmex costatus TaxID=456900 RepID=A0A195CTL4_9HYME|nr:Longitudinals lacking protein, isoforms A/B/D/L [Cyphomyrmex costatus]
MTFRRDTGSTELSSPDLLYHEIIAISAGSTGRFLEPYHARIMDILSVNYSGSQNVIKRENGPFWQSGKMAYHCPRCNAGYTYKKTLKTHMKYDCGKEPRFKCPYCSKRDKCSSNIYKHIRMRHNGKPVYVDRLESSRSSNSSFRDSPSAVGQSS